LLLEEVRSLDCWIIREILATTSRGANRLDWAIILFLMPGMATRRPCIIALTPNFATSAGSAIPKAENSRDFVTCAVAAASYYLVELPFLRRKER